MSLFSKRNWCERQSLTEGFCPRNRRHRAPIALVILALLGTSHCLPQISITNSKHNLSAQGPGTIKAESEGQVCIFCHTPHRSSSIAPLWNKQPTSASYTLYSSDYLTSLSYPAPEQINQKSKLCMSCHDGTVAIGYVYNLAGGGGPGTISMQQSGTPITTMPTNAGGYLGTDLTDDHPVGFFYDAAKDQELVNRAWPWNTPIRLDPDLSTGKVECISCHEPHNNQYSKFLRISNTDAAVCKFCHNKTNFTTSIHDISTSSYTPPGDTATTVGERACLACHKPHSGAGKPYALSGIEQNTCYNGTNTGCHGASALQAANRIEPELQKIWSHPTNTTNGLHKDISGGEAASQLGSSNRHAECQDCHNPHQAQQAVTKATRGALRISAALRGSWGVEPAWPAPTTSMTNNNLTWSAPTVYSKVMNPTDEYQVCLKCHSGYVSLPVGKRDIAAEINYQYKSYHGIVPGGTTNTYVTPTTANEPWGSNKRVWCSDCHGSESSSSPQGPHGSTNSGVGPGTSNSDKLLVATIQSDATNGTPLCLVCHKVTSYWTGATGSRYGEHGFGNHLKIEGCFACHMWDYSSTPATGGNSGKINAHGWNKRWYWREGATNTLGSGQMVDSFNGGYLADIDYLTPKCWTETSNCQHSGGRTTNTWR